MFNPCQMSAVDPGATCFIRGRGWKKLWSPNRCFSHGLYTYHPAFSWTPGCSVALTSALPFCGLFPEAMSQHAPVPLWSQVLQLPPWLVFLLYAQTSCKLCHLPSAVGGVSLAGSVCTLYLVLAARPGLLGSSQMPTQNCC